ncbi:MAG: hypothetical protein ABL958_09410, partial [Bdellovibrionia bacterium]
MVARILIPWLLFSSASSGSISYSHLTKEQSDRLNEAAASVCEQTASLAKETANARLTEAHKRHCLESKPPSLTGLIVAFHHLNIETKQSQAKEKQFFKKNLITLSALVQSSPDYPEPKAAWSIAGSIDELSGLAFDKKRNLIWSLGDSGTGPIIGKTSVGSFKTEKFQVDQANNRDWEAIVLDQDSNVWALDVGDNRALHKSVVLYQFNPEEIKGSHVPLKRKIEVTYKGGARDVEAGWIDGMKLYLVEKAYYRPARIVSVDLGPKSAATQTAEDFGNLPELGPITDAALGPEGKPYLLTYFGVFEVENWKAPAKRALKQINNQILGQIEAMTFIAGKAHVGREDGKV